MLIALTSVLILEAILLPDSTIYTRNVACPSGMCLNIVEVLGADFVPSKLGP